MAVTMYAGFIDGQRDKEPHPLRSSRILHYLCQVSDSPRKQCRLIVAGRVLRDSFYIYKNYALSAGDNEKALHRQMYTDNQSVI